MQDAPNATDILAAVAAWMRDTAGGAPSAFEQRVAAAALDLARRDIEMAPGQHAAEAARLTELLGQGGGLSTQNAELAEAIRARRMTAETPGLLLDHLWQTTLEKVAVDQPGFALYRRLMQKETDEGEGKTS